MKHSKKVLFVALLAAYGAAYATETTPSADPTNVVTTVSGENKLVINNKQSYNVEQGGTVSYTNDYKEDSDIIIDLDPVYTHAVTATTMDAQKILGGKGSPFNIKDPSVATMNGSVIGNDGNVGVNQASGLLNQQANDAALAYWQGGAQNVGKAGMGIFPIPIPIPTPVPSKKVAVHASAMHEQLIDGGEGKMAVGQPYPDNTNAAAANMTGSVLGNAGNVGVNQAAGMANQQKNDLALAVAVGLGADIVGSRAGGSQLQTDVAIDLETGWQNPGGNAVALQNNTTMTGSVVGNQGNIGVNQAAGIGNQQANSLAAAAADSMLISAHAGGFQVIDNPSIVTIFPLKNDATMVASVNNNVGNIGVNQASGLSNQQVNNLAISTNAK